MFLKNLKISAQLIIGFIAMFVFVLIIGFVSHKQTDKMHMQTEIMYEHPFQVRRAISDIKIDILKMRLSTRNLLLVKDGLEQQAELTQIKLASKDVEQQFDILNRLYLGNMADVKNLQIAFTEWESHKESDIKKILSGDRQVIEDLQMGGITNKYYSQLETRLLAVDNFANNKGKSLYISSNNILNRLNWQLYSIIAFISLLIIGISWVIIRNIRNPIRHLASVSQQFQKGNYNARSEIKSRNEFGILSNSFNAMVGSIKMNFDLNEKTSKLIDSMLIIENAHNFFREMLPKIGELTNSQMAAVYILSEDKKCFEHYESIGLDKATVIKSFDKNQMEGEFGSVVSSRKIQHVKNIPIDTSFVFKTVSGQFIPREIISIPIVTNNEIIAIISLASVRKYSEEATKLIDNIYTILTARVEGILNYRKIRRFSRKLEIQNTELEAQKSELDAQSVELTEQNRELEIQKNHLDEANRLKTNFLSNMSHELRTPLNSVIALSGVLNRRLKSKIGNDEYSYLEVIERNGKHLLSLINDILDISRIEAGREEVEISNFNAENLIEDVITMLQPQAQQKNIALTSLGCDKKLQLSSDLHKCKHILQNLIANAIKFTEKGTVKVSYTAKGDNIHFVVKDTGIGISNENLPHIFDEFRQADSSTSRRYGGTGLGLAIAKKYANLLGGEITVISTPDVGSTFTLILPAVYSEEKRIIEEVTTHQRFEINPQKINIQPQSNIKKSNKGQKTILLVDDSEPAIIQMQDFLSSSGYKVLTAQNGSEALEVISKIIPDTMILDLMMPGIDGFEVLKTIREAEQTAHIPVLILTAKHITKEDLNFLNRNNVHQLIQKGDVNRDELIKTIEKLTTDEIPEVTTKPIVNRPQIKGKPKILIVEDNADNMITVKAILNNDYNIIEAVNGIEGVKMAGKHKPDLILMDIALPEMDGIKAFQEIRKDGKLEHIPIIALTASAMTSDRETILAYGFDSYIVKPIDEKEFFSTINEVLYGK